MVYELDVIRNGWTKRISDKQFSSACTISLLRGSKNILVDPGSPWDFEYIQLELSKRGLDVRNIDYVICTHGHVDHIGSIQYFTNANILIGCTLMDKFKIDQYSTINDLLKIDEYVEIMYTPGHTDSDISVIVDCIDSYDKIAIVGDLFECEQDILDSKLWKSSSCNIEIQSYFRGKVYDLVEFIVPGHGPPFRI